MIMLNNVGGRCMYNMGGHIHQTSPCSDAERLGYCICAGGNNKQVTVIRVICLIKVSLCVVISIVFLKLIRVVCST